MECVSFLIYSLHIWTINMVAKHLVSVRYWDKYGCPQYLIPRPPEDTKTHDAQSTFIR